MLSEAENLGAEIAIRKDLGFIDLSNLCLEQFGPHRFYSRPEIAMAVRPRPRDLFKVNRLVLNPLS